MKINSTVRQFGSVFRHHLSKPAVVLVSVAAVSAGGVGGLAYALTSGTSTGSAAGSVATAPPVEAGTVAQNAGGAPGRARGLARTLRILGRAVHAEVVIPARGGGFRTIDLDRGTIATVSSTSVTISPISGGAAITAAITSSTREPKNSSLSQGEEVVLVYSNGDALLVRPARNVAPGSAIPATSNTTTP